MLRRLAILHRWLRRAWSRLEPAAPDDATIGRLEGELAEERQRADELGKSVDELRFQLEVLEKSYTTQLAEARQRCGTVEAELAALQQQTAELERTHEDTLAALDKARTELELHAGGSPRSRPQGDAPTLDELMQESDSLAGGQRVEPAVAAEELLAPDVVFSADDDD